MSSASPPGTPPVEPKPTPKIAVVGVGSFGKNHLRVIHESEHESGHESGLAELAGLLDIEPARAAELSAQYECPSFSSLEKLAAASDAAVVATPSSTHADIGCRLMELGCDVLVEKPIAESAASGQRLVDTAKRTGRILQVGHLERFNPGVIALQKVITHPLFFEIHRMSQFSPRSLDVDVILDLMIHDIDIVLALTGQMPVEIRAAGVHILSEKVDIANVRLQFADGCVANLTASRVSTERIRKLRLFQPKEYISLDYGKREGVRFTVGENRSIGFARLTSNNEEPLKLELEDFFGAVGRRTSPLVTGEDGLKTLQVAEEILDKIEEHSALVAQALDVGGES